MDDQSPDMTDILEDDLDRALPVEVLGVPSRVATLVNSPTTDTLDSVALEPSPTDEDECEEKTDGINDAESDQQGPITFNTSNDTSPTSETLSNEQQITDITDTFSQVEVGNQETANQPQPSLSSYFDSPFGDTDATDFFDSISGPPESPGLQTVHQSDIIQADTSGLQALTESQFDSLTGGDQGSEMEQSDLQVSQLEDPEVDLVQEAAHSDTQPIHREPESIPFEGETLLAPRELQGSSEDLLSKSGFESFTAQGEETLGPCGDGGEMMKASNQESSLKTAEQSMLFPGYQQAHQTPSVGTTPTQLSPLSTPVHQTATSAPPLQQSPGAYSYSQPPGLDRQTSVPSAPPSPFRQFDGPATTTPSAFSTFTDGADDPFTSSLSTSDADRRYDAWLPSDATRHILVTMATSAPGSYVPPAEHLSCPRVMSSEPQGDPVRDLVYRYMGEQESVKRKVLTSLSVPQDFAGLEHLISAGCLRAAVDLTGKMLADAGQGEATGGEPTQQSQYTLQLWFCRLSLLVRLRLYDVADTELRGFQTLDTPDLYYEFYPHLYPGRRGSMVPFGMRLLHAELPSFLGRNQEALDKLYYVLAVINRMLCNLDTGLAEDGSVWEMSADSRNKSMELWRQREVQTLYKIAGVMVFVKDYEAALSVYESLEEKVKDNMESLRSGIGRIYLQMGNVPDALTIFKQLEAESEKGDNTTSCRNSVNRGLAAMCQNNFSEAYGHFKLAVQLEPLNTCAVNNMAVCSLYLGRLKDALNTLESLVHRDPANNLHEGILFNLCTLYELESSRALHKKQTMLDLVSRHKGDGFPIVCLKMT
ncbi:trafficking protein particle complex subunit 12-like [Haliotis cracherodii]|uniref:trafficking protein particle complex subunit 12-like n=1 Tax=Haliotis cracherodii TaxID=6455 RepID=UPI0039E84208